MSDPPLHDCPECGGVLRKLLYPVGVQFKGSGFYTTDYKSGRSAESTSGDGRTKESGSESKPAKADSSAPAKSDDRQQ